MDKHKWDVTMFSVAKGRWITVANSITYTEFLTKFGTGNHADFRLTSA